MDLIWKMKAMNLTNLFLNGEHDRICAYEYTPQKKKLYGSVVPKYPFPKGSPESQGISSRLIEAFFRTLETTERLYPHSAVILRRGVIIAEGYWKPYRADVPQMMYSLSKSVTSTAVGIAISEGRFGLDDRLSDIFPGRGLSVSSLFREPLRIRHLLTMSSGVGFNEVGSMLDRDWIRTFLESDLAFEPGTKFQYNSMNSYMLSAAIRERTGQGLLEYLRPRLLDPLEIGEVEWETSPRGIEKGGWGLCLTAMDMAKLGQLYLQNGLWGKDGNQVRLIPEEWVREATRPHIFAPSGDGKDGYGYQIWMCSRKGAYQFNGAFGQILIVVPDQELVVAVTGGSECAFLTDSPSDVVERFFYDDGVYSGSPLPESPEALASLRDLLDHLTVFRPRPRVSDSLSSLKPRKTASSSVPPLAGKADGVEFHMEKNNGAVLPLIQQMVHANYSRGFSRFKVSFSPGECSLLFSEGKDVNLILAGMDGRPRYSPVTVGGEQYLVGASASWGEDPGNRDELRVIISFVETPNTRLLRIAFEETGIVIHFGESPGFFRTLRLFALLVSGDDETQKKLMDRKLRQENLLSRARSYTEAEARGYYSSEKSPSQQTP
ncbi:serine hydrolase domain-containing protein [Papillibacter cinnamivorans]|uniref:CubicO group peptidase, beta-lactamase class C family n=1 Tax=Papillibacter cinnamivorans DSM 12816 TaxID=1122930 RepID=A0A1W1YP61_9FIRM|nr:serine hydrolase [Papillibacter cinnamivorans]SMC37528.1 CubicO group peptidase, beta-lactamase class C family [Papillibacter cinnamivorans DSM 12816]